MSILRSWQLHSWENYLPCVVHEVSLLCTTNSATGPYPVPDKSRQLTHSFIKNNFNNILPFKPKTGAIFCFFSWRFRTRPVINVGKILSSHEVYFFVLMIAIVENFTDSLCSWRIVAIRYHFPFKTRHSSVMEHRLTSAFPRLTPVLAIEHFLLSFLFDTLYWNNRNNAE